MAFFYGQSCENRHGEKVIIDLRDNGSNYSILDGAR